jgi:DNA-directed RNA polymerase specialized sigma24 family protein
VPRPGEDGYPAPEPDCPAPDLRLEGVADRDCLLKALCRISKKDRAVFVMRFIMGMTHEDIMRATHVGNLSTAKSRVIRSRKAIRKAIFSVLGKKS